MTSVVPPLPTSPPVPAVTPSICRLNLPGSPVGGIRFLITVIVPVLGTDSPEISTASQVHFDVWSAYTLSSSIQLGTLFDFEFSQLVQVATSAVPLPSLSWHMIENSAVSNNACAMSPVIDPSVSPWFLLMSPQTSLGSSEISAS